MERVRRALEQARFPIGSETVSLTVSIGVADRPSDGTTFLEVLKAANAAEGRSKREGKNRITVSAGEPGLAVREHAAPALQSEEVKISPEAGPPPDDSPGTLDRLAALEDALPRLLKTIESATVEIGEVEKTISGSADELNRANDQGTGFRARLSVARKTAVLLTPPANRLLELGRSFESDIREIDAGMGVLVPGLTREAAQGEEHRRAACSFFNTVRQFGANAAKGLAAAAAMAEATNQLDGHSRDLRPPLRILREGLTRMVAAGRVVDGWVQMIAQSGVSCEPPEADPVPVTAP